MGILLLAVVWSTLFCGPMTVSNPDTIASETTGDGGGVTVAIVLGIHAGVFVILVLLSRLLEDLEAGKRKRIASILRLDGVAPSRAYEQGRPETKSEPRSSCSFDNVIVW
ncbi:hypothetical protein X797_011576 [Metarhizium robertsii]|uniref:Uncharacterized protein n=1 Tax=Metarhizium robertsii TaxID=568076 RepID=A0A014N6J0_9HYPO|nr:hypothetical protein X797_011576 [Metarhizium robertsii]